MRRLRGLFLVVLCTFFAAASELRAEGGAFVSSLEIQPDGECSTITIRTAQAVSFMQGAAAHSAASLSIALIPIAPITGSKETVLVPSQNSARLTSLSVKFPDGKAELEMSFSEAVETRVQFGQDTTHVEIKVAKQSVSDSCSDNKQPESSFAEQPVDRFTAAKQALARGELPRVIVIFSEAAENGPAAQRAEARELLGLAYERKGDFAQARSAYQLYLRDYPNAPRAGIVRERFSALAAAEQVVSDKTDDGSMQLSASQGKGNLELVKTVRKSGLPANTSLKARLHEHDSAPDPLAWVWNKYGSFSTFYYHDEDFSAGITAESQQITSGDYVVNGQNEDYKFSARASGYARNRFVGDGKSIGASVSELYVDATDRDLTTHFKIGRQTENDHGVFGRFDGALVEFSPLQQTTFGLLAGSPAYTRDQQPFADNRFFVAGGVTTDIPRYNLRGTFYTIEQEVGDIVDRRAIGTSWIYEDSSFTTSVSADYDIFYDKLSSGRIDFNWHGRDDLTVYGALDYQTVPFLTTTNAMVGQFSETLGGLQNILGQDELTVMAEDRTADAINGSFGFSYSLNSTWQLAVDALIADYSGTIASRNVDEVRDTGLEIYGIASATGNNIFVAGDVLGLGLRFSESDFSRYVAADGYLRYPVNDRLKLTPRIRAGWRNSKSTGLDSYILQPSLGARYKISKFWNFESELGLDWQFMTGPDILDLRTFIGLRYEF